MASKPSDPLTLIERFVEDAHRTVQTHVAAQRAALAPEKARVEADVTALLKDLDPFAKTIRPRWERFQGLLGSAHLDRLAGIQATRMALEQEVRDALDTLTSGHTQLLAAKRDLAALPQDPDAATHELTRIRTAVNAARGTLVGCQQRGERIETLARQLAAHQQFTVGTPAVAELPDAPAVIPSHAESSLRA